MKNKFKQLYNKASKGYLKKSVEELLASKPGQAHNTLRKMGARPGEEEDSIVTELSEFLNTNLDRNQVTDKIAEYFTTISKEFKPVNIETLPLEVKEAIEMAVPDQVPDIHPEEVGALLRTINTNKSMTKDDILPVLYKAGNDILKYPATALFN